MEKSASFLLLRGNGGLFEIGLYCHTLFVAYKVHNTTRSSHPALAVLTAILAAFGGGIIGGFSVICKAFCVGLNLHGVIC